MSGSLAGVEPRHWASLLALADEGSFRAAAERRGHAGSAIRHHLAQLERVAGVPLVERDGRTVMLTTAGAALAEHARGIVGQLDAMAADLRGAPLRVGTADHGAARLLAAALPGAVAVEVVVAELGGAADQQDAVARGELDAAVGEAPPATAPFTVAALLEDPIVLVVARSPDAHGVPASPAGPREVSALTLAADAGWPTLDLLRARVRAAGFEPPEVLHVGAGVSAQAVAAATGAAALLPASAVEDDGSATVVVRLRDLVPPRALTVYWHAHRRRTSELMVLAEALGRAARTVAA
ncbi:LysR family transcriptional regulator [Conexibacter woesei]|uniref:LysR family transcriptional regulator n=1 Tax=Conexibacter woesei TaxID=191495 RepID=UPI000429FCFC|nr:LysR family transcriptional regulator [Conexibacter woesei]